MARHTYAVTWDQLHRDARALAWRLIALGPFRGVVAITRGGLIPAAIVARELEARVIETVSVTAYGQGEAEWTELGTPQVVKAPVAAGNGAGWLLIDDLVDTGTTAKVVRALLPAAHFATVYAKPAGKGLVDTFITEVSQDTWIMFPWDTEAQFAVPLAKREKPAGSPAE
jgi:xanthine phosphoribosyltransferase